jgi:hypothetical protein
MIIRERFLIRRRASFSWIAAVLFSFVAVADAVILFRTGDPGANTTEPTSELAGSGWQYQGTFGNFLGTPIAPHFFITAKHIGGAPRFFFRGTNYTVLGSFDDPSSDLRIWEVAETFPSYAPLYTGNAEIGKRLVVIGRGTRRGPERVVLGEVRGWEWSTSDLVQRWGENQVANITRSAAGADLLYALFDQAGLPHEAHLSGGDSGGGVFLNDGGVWKLAGISYDVDSFASGPDGGGPYNAAMFDQRGSYTALGLLVTGALPVPSGFYASRISSSFSWISSIIAPRLANISARAAVGQGEQVGIAGFIIQGASDQSKRVIVRGLGPSLQVAGVPVSGRMADPVLELHDATGLTVSFNDNWGGSQRAEIQESGLAPADAREPAIIATLSPGNYTAVLRGSNESGGTGLIEVYELDPASGSRLLNLSTRAYVGTGDEVLIGGLIVHSVSTRLLLRALGPQLASRGIGGVLLNPTLELHDSNGALLTVNDDWRSAPNSSEIAATGLAPAYEREPAILIATPGATSYTAIVRGAGNTTGIALLEAYLVN